MVSTSLHFYCTFFIFVLYFFCISFVFLLYFFCIHSLYIGLLAFFMRSPLPWMMRTRESGMKTLRCSPDAFSSTRTRSPICLAGTGTPLLPLFSFFDFFSFSFSLPSPLSLSYPLLLLILFATVHIGSFALGSLWYLFYSPLFLLV